MIAEVLLDSNANDLNKIFDYEIPDDLKVIVGSRVFVPFGNRKNLEEGFVIGIKEKSNYKLKQIVKLQDEQITEEYIELAKWMAKRYFCNIAECFRLMLPPGRTNKIIDKRIKEKNKNIVKINVSEKEIIKLIEGIKSEKQKKVLEYILKNENLNKSEIANKVEVSVGVIDTLIKKEILKIEKLKQERNPLININIERSGKLKLNQEQKNAFEKIGDRGKFLLYGVTGSGKTEIYLQLIEKMLKENKSSIILVPEISLTPQTINRFVARFGDDKIAVLHSKLSIGERFDEWNRIRNGEAKIIIGARSAIFAPAVNLGTVIIDEEHDDSYCSDKNPRYDAREIAEYLVNEKEAILILGSATPDMRSFYKTEKNNYKILELNERANNAVLPEIEIVDLRQELAENNNSLISKKLYIEIEENLKNKKQTLLYLNRRGFSNFVLCKDCGETVKCDRCDITLTYHKKDGKLKCHYCGFEKEVISFCDKCNSKNIEFVGNGTQKLEDEIKEIFPKASVLRMDIDTVNKKNSHEEILREFREKNIDILIGTQMIVKGHHFENVTLVGVIMADTDLNMGDYRATEKTFQTLTQVAGRAGREKDKGKVIIQTYNPDNYAIELSKAQDYKMFYNIEVNIRKHLKYPPFYDIILLNFISLDENEMKKIILEIYKFLRSMIEKENLKLLIYKPVYNPVMKIQDKYRMRILIKTKYNEKINTKLNELQKYFYKLKNKNTRMSIEINPNSMI